MKHYIQYIDELFENYYYDYMFDEIHKTDNLLTKHHKKQLTILAI